MPLKDHALIADLLNDCRCFLVDHTAGVGAPEPGIAMNGRLSGVRVPVGRFHRWPPASVKTGLAWALLVQRRGRAAGGARTRRPRLREGSCASRTCGPASQLIWTLISLAG